MRFADLLPRSWRTTARNGIVLVGEVGGDEEEEFADALAGSATGLTIRKPVYAIVAGKEAKEGVSMGHAGALTYGEYRYPGVEARPPARGWGRGVRLHRGTGGCLCP